jgi:alcohol dehydrogenase (NADP+)
MVSSPKMPLEQYLMLLWVNGHFIRIGVPEDKLPPFGAFSPSQGRKDRRECNWKREVD